jgi:uncharacterized protein GlcG (DUF336 family)
MKTSVTLQTLTLDCAQQIITAALAHARAASMAPLAVTVLDVRGALKAYGAEEGTSLYRYEISNGKALGALGMGFGGREVERRFGVVPGFIGAVGMLTDGNLVPVPGGVLVRDAQGQLLGAVGISGETSHNDEIAALAGIQAVGLVADTGAPKA